jgi:hypothetical protein
VLEPVGVVSLVTEQGVRFRKSSIIRLHLCSRSFAPRQQHDQRSAPTIANCVELEYRLPLLRPIRRGTFPVLKVGGYRRPPNGTDVEAALASSAATIASMRQKGATRHLSDDMVRRIFGLSFGLEQLGRNLVDMSDRTTEFATERKKIL